MTAGLACRAPSTTTEAIAARASSGVTSCGDAGKAEHPDVERLAGSARRFEILAAVVPQAEVEALARDGLLGRVGMPLDLVADGGADEVGAVRVEALLHQQVDVAEVDIAEVDRDLLGVAGVLGRSSCTLPAICLTIL